MKSFQIYIPLLLIITLSCSELSTNSQETVLSQLESATWQLVYINGEPVSDNLAEQNIPTILFDVDQMRVYGGGGCNAYFGSFKLDRPNRLTISELGSTKKLCNEIELEKEYFTALQSSERISVTAGDHVLNLKNSEQQTLLSYVRMDP
jgi:heat shock protein HslJ